MIKSTVKIHVTKLREKKKNNLTSTSCWLALILACVSGLEVVVVTEAPSVHELTALLTVRVEVPMQVVALTGALGLG